MSMEPWPLTVRCSMITGANAAHYWDVESLLMTVPVGITAGGDLSSLIRDTGTMKRGERVFIPSNILVCVDSSLKSSVNSLQTLSSLSPSLAWGS